MDLGVFAKTFPRPTIAGVFEAIADAGFSATQFNFACAGLDVLPESIPDCVVHEIKAESARHGITTAAISATFNIIDPDLEQRDRNLQRLATLASICEPVGTSILTMSTGTRNAHDMWEAHPDNGSEAAWKEMTESLRLALWLTEPYGVTLALEPEPGNVMSDIGKARRLLDEIASPRLKVLFDAANVLDGMPDMPPPEALIEAFQIAGPDIALAHGKERTTDANGAKVPGKGSLDWALYLRLLREHYSGPLILHGFEERYVAEAVDFFKHTLADHRSAQ